MQNLKVRLKVITLRVRSAGLSLLPPVELEIWDAVHVDEGGDDDEYVENLVRLEDEVEAPRPNTLWKARRVENRAENIQQRHKDQPVDLTLSEWN